MADDEHDPLETFKRVRDEWKDPFREVADVAVAVLDSLDAVLAEDRDQVERRARQLLDRVIAIQQADQIPSHRLGDAARRLAFSEMQRECDQLRVAVNLRPAATERFKQKRALDQVNADVAGKHDQWRTWDAELPAEWRGRPKIERGRKLKRDHDIEEKAETIAKKLL